MNPLSNLASYIGKSTAKREIMDEETARSVVLYVSKFFEQQPDVNLDNSLSLRNQITAWLVAKRHEDTGRELATSSKQLIARHVGSYCVHCGWLSEKDYGILCRHFIPQYTPWSNKALSTEQVNSILRYFDDKIYTCRLSLTGTRNFLAVMTMLAVGLRIGQITHLLQTDVVYANGKFIVHPILQKRSGSGKSVKTIPDDIEIGGFVFSEAIKEFQKFSLKNAVYYFHNNNGGIISEDYYRKVFQHAEADLGFPFSAHFLRHTAGTRTANKVGIVAAANLLDHQSIQTTQRYVTLTKDTSDIVSRSFQ